MPQHPTDHKSTLVQVMALCRQATSHYMGQCWPTSMSPYDVTRPQWVKRQLRKWRNSLRLGYSQRSKGYGILSSLYLHFNCKCFPLKPLATLYSLEDFNPWMKTGHCEGQYMTLCVSNCDCVGIKSTMSLWIQDEWNVAFGFKSITTACLSKSEIDLNANN